MTRTVSALRADLALKAVRATIMRRRNNLLSDGVNCPLWQGIKPRGRVVCLGEIWTIRG